VYQRRNEVERGLDLSRAVKVLLELKRRAWYEVDLPLFWRARASEWLNGVVLVLAQIMEKVPLL